MLDPAGAAKTAAGANAATMSVKMPEKYIAGFYFLTQTGFVSEYLVKNYSFLLFFISRSGGESGLTHGKLMEDIVGFMWFDSYWPKAHSVKNIASEKANAANESRKRKLKHDIPMLSHDPLPYQLVPAFESCWLY